VTRGFTFFLAIAACIAGWAAIFFTPGFALHLESNSTVLNHGIPCGAIL
jgi:hypothetical protein